MRRTFQKWHGAGNDFLVEVGTPADAAWWTPARAAAVLDRHSGVGADGLLLATVGEGLSMTLYNADGSTAEMSGNGARCLAAAVHRATAAEWTEVTLATPSGPRNVRLFVEGDAGVGEVEMGEVVLGATLPGTLGTAVVGNPHAVVADDPGWDRAERESRAGALSHAMGGANVEFVTAVAADRLAMTVIERGVGWTRACGTGSVAAAAVARAAGLVGDVVTVANPGGDLTVRLNGHRATL
ncbi:MAG TPA: diaminopimelate epimerase, partial [Acidimicrobiales bacterium]|nr:diaminopimelate epimerase [Acidimicrobiales bacterium]